MMDVDAGARVDEWRALLSRLPALWQELHVTKCRQDVIANRSASAVSSSPLVFRVDASEVQWRIRDLLQTIASRYDMQAGQVIRYRQPGELMVLLARHVAWVAKHADAEVWMDELSALDRQGWQVVNRPPDLIRLGVCGAALDDGFTCQAELWHEPGQTAVECPMCSTVTDVAHRKDQDLARAARYRAPLSVVVEALAATGVPVRLEQARKWTQRRDRHGRALLEPATTRADGTKLYEVGEVLRVATSRRAKRAGTSER